MNSYKCNNKKVISIKYLKKYILCQKVKKKKYSLIHFYKSYPMMSNFTAPLPSSRHNGVRSVINALKMYCRIPDFVPNNSIHQYFINVVLLYANIVLVKGISLLSIRTYLIWLLYWNVLGVESDVGFNYCQ